MGKDFFSRKAKSDFFETPYSMTEQLLENEKFDYDKDVLEPACGNGAIINVLSNNFKDIGYIDKYIKRKSVINQDFIVDEMPKYNYIITNPPFSLWDEFIQKAKHIATEKFAFLGRLEFLTGIKRFNENMYDDPKYPLTKIYLFTRKVNLSYTEDYPKLRKDSKYPAGMYHYAWFIFEKNDISSFNSVGFYIGRYPQIKWVNNQKYILHKKDK